MLFPCPFGPLTTAALAAKAAGLQATVLLLLTLLIKSRLQIKAASALGLFLLFLQTLVFLTVAGGLGVAAAGGAAVAFQRRQSPAA